MTVIADPPVRVLGQTLTRGQQFLARNGITGRVHRYTYRGSSGTSPNGERWLNATDGRGNARSIAVSRVTRVVLAKGGAG